MRRKIYQKILALFCAVLAVSALFPSRAAYAYVDYSGDVALSRYGAAYEYLREHGGGSSLPSGDDVNASEFQNQLGFGSSIIAAPSSPFLRFAINYVLFVPFVGWRVTEASDISNSDSREAYEHLLNEAVDFLEDEWSRWKEDYPAAGAGGGSSGGGSGDVVTNNGAIYVVHVNNISDGVYTFADGSTYTVPTGTAANFAAVGVSSFFWLGSSDHTTTNNFSDYRWPNGRIDSERFAVVVNPSFNRPSSASDIGTSTAFMRSSGGSTIKYVQASSGYIWSNNSAAIPSTSALPGYPEWFPSAYPAVVDPGGISSANARYYYVFTNCDVYSWGELLYGDTVGPSPSPDPDGPIGPTAPDYETPAPVSPTAPTVPSITNNITNNPTSYTGSETDYSDYLKIIIDNQKEQIQQFSDWSDYFGDHMDAFVEWLEVWFKNFAEYLDNTEVFWNTLFKWQKSITDYLYSIDQQFKFFRTTFDDFTSKLWGWLRDILQNMPKGGGGGTSRPTVSTDNPFADATDPLWEWLSNFVNGLISMVTAGAASAAASAGSALGGLSGIFPFSLLADLTFMLGLLSHDPVAPVFDVPYPFAADRNAVLIHVDLSPWSDMVQSLYPMWILLFALGLAYLSVDIIMALYRMLSPTGGDA